MAASYHAMIIIATFVLNAGLNFVLGLVVAKFLGAEEFGRYAIAAAVAVVINTIFLDWIRLSASRFYSQRMRETEPGVRATLDMTHAIICLTLICALGLALALRIDLRLPASLAAAAVVMGVCNGLFDYHAALARARFMERTYALLVIFKNVAAFVLMVGGAWYWRDATLVAMGFCLSVAGALVAARRALAEPEAKAGAARRDFAFTYLRYGWPLVAAVLFYQLIPLMNRTAAAAHFGYAEAGYFSLAYDIGVRLFAAAGSALDIFLFQIAVRADELHGRAEAERQIGRNAVIVMAFLLPAAAGYWLILPSFEALFVPAAFRGHFSAYSQIFVPALAAFALIQYGLNPIFQLAKRTWPVIGAALCALIGAAALSLVLPYRYGPLGYAWAQFGGMACALVMALFLASRAMRFQPLLRDVGVICAATFAMVAACWPLRDMSQPMLVLPAIVLLGSAVYTGLIFAGDVGGVRSLTTARLAAWRTRLAA
jgi:O-antigen/teichoic acid export membrane protein